MGQKLADSRFITGPLLLAAILVIVTGAIGLPVLGLRASPALSTTGRIQLATPGVVFIEASTDDRGVDPGYEVDVATCTALIGGPDTVAIDIANSYPSYTCRLTISIENTSDTPLRCAPPLISAPPELTVATMGPPCGDLAPGDRDVEVFAVHIEPAAAQRATYRFTINKQFLEADPARVGIRDGRHSQRSLPAETGRPEGIDGFNWFGTLYVEGMDAALEAAHGGKATPKGRLLAYYLASRSNLQAGGLCSASPHAVGGNDRDKRLGLTDPETATFGEMLGAMETNTGKSTTDDQVRPIGAICDALNNAAL